jgi:hypothetical protein
MTAKHSGIARWAQRGPVQGSRPGTRPVEVDLSRPARAEFARLRDVLLEDPAAVFSEAQTVAARHATRIRLALSVDLGAGASVHQEVVLRLGVAQPAEIGFVVPVAWRAVGRGWLFPAFIGELAVSKACTDSSLRLSGTYTVPLGVVGRLGDRVVGWRFARRSLEAFLDRLAERLETEVERRRQSAPWSSPDSVAPPEWDRHPEIYIG